MKNKNVVQKIVVGGILVERGKVLVLQRHASEKIYPGMWELPSGKREKFESTEKAVVREFKEETGLNIKVVKPISLFEYKIEKNNEIRDSVQINFLVKLKIGKQKVVLSREHQDYAWIDRKSLRKYKLSKLTEQTIKRSYAIKKA